MKQKPNKGGIEITPGDAWLLKQNQFEFDEQTVLNTVLMGHAKLWKMTHERELIYAKADFDEEDGNGRALELEHDFRWAAMKRKVMQQVC